ncbi:hypothetical protein [Desmospora activa]|uniref:Lipoprotein n=1 Tax=Desmospora activa DSM 45169 TaxID=1121389 RepID=A0A2T4Z6M0_9BACL|nr:hypothetical protein [Desmospora activa]PTM57532.1 hypothetical protein C8J48_0080 [Desmospora activa DSM 45169]
MLVKWSFRLFMGLTVMALLSGCGLLLGADKGSDEGKQDDQAKEETEEEKKKEDDEYAEAQESNETYEEIKFRPISWIGGAPDRQGKGGIWVYNESKHPGNFPDSFDWSEEDVLLIQINESQYKGKKLNVRGLQKVRDDVVRIVVNLEEDGTGDDAPRLYLKVDKGALDDMKFVVETEDGEKVNTNE